MRDLHTAREWTPELGATPKPEPAARAVAKPPKKRFWNFITREKQPSVPAGRRVYAIGDIHGHSETLRRLVGKILAEAQAWKGKTDIVFVGDYVDRGPDSRGVVELLLGLPETVSPHFIRGNHEQALLDFLNDPTDYLMWQRFGADETLLSYGVPPPDVSKLSELREARNRFAAALPVRHRQFFANLVPSITIGDYHFVHAGVRPGVPLARQTDHDLMWIREEFLLSEEKHGKIIVHGHTPYPEPVQRPNRIGVDTGVYITGRLTALCLEGDRRRFLQS
jgi:serine/threonine protein phosphatase 1